MAPWPRWQAQPVQRLRHPLDAWQRAPSASELPARPCHGPVPCSSRAVSAMHPTGAASCTYTSAASQAPCRPPRRKASSAPSQHRSAQSSPGNAFFLTRKGLMSLIANGMVPALCPWHAPLGRLPVPAAYQAAARGRGSTSSPNKPEGSGLHPSIHLYRHPSALSLTTSQTIACMPDHLQPNPAAACHRASSSSPYCLQAAVHCCPTPSCTQQCPHHWCRQLPALPLSAHPCTPACSAGPSRHSCRRSRSSRACALLCGRCGASRVHASAPGGCCGDVPQAG